MKMCIGRIDLGSLPTQEHLRQALVKAGWELPDFLPGISVDGSGNSVEFFAASVETLLGIEPQHAYRLEQEWPTLVNLERVLEATAGKGYESLIPIEVVLWACTAQRSIGLKAARAILGAGLSKDGGAELKVVWIDWEEKRIVVISSTQRDTVSGEPVFLLWSYAPYTGDYGKGVLF